MQTEDETWTTERSLFKKVTESTALIAWATDEYGRRFYLSPAWYLFTGAKEGDLDWLDQVRSEEREEVGQAFADANDRKIAFGMTYWLKRKDGGYTRVWDVGLPKFDDNFEFRGFFGSACLLDEAESPPVLRQEAPKLSPRELEVLRLVADGNTSETVAALLGIAARTVEAHVSRATSKLGAINRVHAVTLAIRRNEL